MSYESAYDETVSTELGSEHLDAVRLACQACQTAAGEFTAMDVIDDVTGIRGGCDCWLVLNALDHLVTMGELRELTDRDKVWGQNRRYRWGTGA